MRLKSKTVKNIEPSSMALMIQAISQAKDLSAVSDTIVKFNTYQSYEKVHIVICKIDDLPVIDIIHNCPISGLGMSVNDFDDELKWAICKESEHLLRPFNLLTHQFRTSETDKFKDLRDRAARAGLKQIIIMPFRTKNTIIVTIMNFHDADFESQASDILPKFYQLTLTLLIDSLNYSHGQRPVN